MFAIVALAFASCQPETPPAGNPDDDNPDEEQPTPTPDPESDFVLEIEEIGGTTCITRVTPADKQMYYILYKAEIQYFYDCEVTNAEELFENDMFYFKRGAAYDGMALKEYLEQWNMLFQGDMRGLWSDLIPGQTHILYVYGIEFTDDFEDCARVTDVYWIPITPPTAERREVVFDVELSVSGADVSFDIAPKDYDGYYTLQIFDSAEELYYDASQGVTDEYVTNVAASWVSMFNNNLVGGLSTEQILQAVAQKGEQRLSYELGSYVRYTAVLYAVEEVEGFYQMVSHPVVINFSTEQVQASDMTINIAVDNLHVRVCDLTVTPSADDETYALLLMPTEYLSTGYTDQTLIDLALGEYSYYTNFLRGEVTSHVSSLYPETEYILYAFGYSGGVVTTPIFKNVFTTEPEGECELAITDVACGGPYRPSELKALDPKRFFDVPDDADDYMFVMWMEVKTDTPTADIFTYFVDTDTYNYYGEETIFFDLLISTCDPVETTLASYGLDYYICAAAFDYKGDVTPMWRSEALTFSASETRPAQELVDKLNASSMAKAVLVRSAAK